MMPIPNKTKWTLLDPYNYTSQHEKLGHFALTWSWPTVRLFEDDFLSSPAVECAGLSVLFLP